MHYGFVAWRPAALAWAVHFTEFPRCTYKAGGYRDRHRENPVSLTVMRVLVIDIGGSNVKFALCGQRRRSVRSFPSGKRLTPRQMVKKVIEMTADWSYRAVSIGYPGPVMSGRTAGEPPNLGKGWVGYDFEGGFRKPVKIINDAAMQALGSYRGGRMLFVGLGTGLGSALILDDVIVPLELGDLSYSKGRLLFDVLGKEALKANGRSKWEASVHRVTERLAAAFRTDYLVIGGGNVKRIKQMPAGTRRGSNHMAFLGGSRLWNPSTFHAKPKKHTWVIT